MQRTKAKASWRATMRMLASGGKRARTATVPQVTRGHVSKESFRPHALAFSVVEGTYSHPLAPYEFWNDDRRLLLIPLLLSRVTCARVYFDRLRCVRNRVLFLARSHLHVVLERETPGAHDRRCHRRACCGLGDCFGLPVCSVGGARRGENRMVPSQGTSSRSPSGLEDHRRRVADSDTGRGLIFARARALYEQWPCSL